MECIFGKRETGLSGFIGVSGAKRDYVRMAVIPQHESFLSGLTVLETLQYASQLLQITIDCEAEVVAESVNHRQRSMDILSQFGIDSIAHKLIQNCSPSEQKRISVFIELFGSPDILTLDEPTTGLDSIDAFDICQLLRTLAREKQLAVAMTIHQPANRVFCQFDKVYMLSNQNGTCIYEGVPIDLNERFFINYEDLKVPDRYNPADYLLEVAAGDHCSVETLNLMAARQREAFESSSLINLLHTTGHRSQTLTSLLSNRSTTWYSLFVQTSLLLSRGFRITSRKRGLIVMSFLMTGILLGLIGGVVGKSCGYDGCPPLVSDPSTYSFADYRHACITNDEFEYQRITECRTIFFVYSVVLVMLISAMGASQTYQTIFNTIRGEIKP